LHGNGKTPAWDPCERNIKIKYLSNGKAEWLNQEQSYIFASMPFSVAFSHLWCVDTKVFEIRVMILSLFNELPDNFIHYL
jgi:hypothetical protein